MNSEEPGLETLPKITEMPLSTHFRHY